MNSRIGVPLLCLLVWGLVLACSEATAPTESFASFKAAGRVAVGFNGDVGGFPTGAVRLAGGGSYDLGTASNTVPTVTSASLGGGCGVAGEHFSGQA
jgi:hypothetical protein